LHSMASPYHKLRTITSNFLFFFVIAFGVRKDKS
jgi:hypothetical protein